MDFAKILNLDGESTLVGAVTSLTFTMAEKRPAQNLLDVLDEAELDEAPTAPKKPRRGRPPGSTSSKKKKSNGKLSGVNLIMGCAGPHSLVLVAVIGDDDADGGGAVPVPAPTSLNISYTFDIYTTAQMKKPSKKRGDPKRSVMVLKSDEPWDTFKAQTLTRIDKALKPATVDIGDYKIVFTVPRIQKTTDLEDEESYHFMIGRALRSGDPSAVICIEPLISDEVSYILVNVFFILMIVFRNPIPIRKTKKRIVAAAVARVRVTRAIVARKRGKERRRKGR